MKKHLYLLIFFAAKTSLAANYYYPSQVDELIKNAYLSFQQYSLSYSDTAKKLVGNIHNLYTVADWPKEKLLPLTIALVYNAQSARLVLPSQQFYLDAPGEVIRLEAENEQLKKKNEFFQEEITRLKQINEELLKNIGELAALED